MDYQAIDPDEAVDALLAQHAKEADVRSLAAVIDMEKVKFLQGVRVAANKDLDPELEAFNVNAASTAVEAAAKAAERLGRMTKPLEDKEITDTRREQLTAWLASWEAEHAQHGLLIELAESPEQVEASTLAQLVIEGAVTAAREELAGKPGPRK